MTRCNCSKDGLHLCALCGERFGLDVKPAEPVGQCGCRLDRTAEGLHMIDCPLHAAAPDMFQALQGLFEHCAMIHKRWGKGCNQKESDDAIEFARAAIAKAQGE